MSKFKICFFLGIALIIYSSCGTVAPPQYLYGPALYAHDISYQPKPLSSDSIHHANYASVSFNSGEAPNIINSSDQIKSGQLNIGQGFTFNHFNLSYGAFGELGTYTNQTVLEPEEGNYFNSKTFGAIGGRFSANTFLTSGSVDIRLIGFEMAYSHEFGDYAGYRKSLNNQMYYFIDTRTNLVTIGGTTEVIWHTKRQPAQFGFRVFIGQTLGNNFYKNANTPAQNHLPTANPSSLAYFMQVKRYFFIAEVSPTVAGQLRVGVRF